MWTVYVNGVKCCENEFEGIETDVFSNFPEYLKTVPDVSTEINGRVWISTNVNGEDKLVNIYVE